MQKHYEVKLSTCKNTTRNEIINSVRTVIVQTASENFLPLPDMRKVEINEPNYFKDNDEITIYTSCKKNCRNGYDLRVVVFPRGMSSNNLADAFIIAECSVDCPRS